MAGTVLASLLLALTAVMPQWIELIFGFEPDAVSGEAEWLVAGSLAAIVVVSGLVARHELRRTAQS
jgi:hypothetical protein